MDRRTPPSSLAPAPYGRACVECAQSKCKCILRKDDSRCERCHRLNKECHPSATVRRRNPKKSVVSKSARLEAKLDDLVSLLKAEAQSDAIITDTQATAIYDSTHHSSKWVNDKTFPHNQSDESSIAGVLNDYAPNLPVLTPETLDSQGTSSDSSASVLQNAAEPSPLEAEGILTTFRIYKSRYFPFINISPSTTAHKLRQERPFLWLCITMIASTSTSQQQVLDSKVREILAQEVIMKSEQSIDLLLGLLTYIGWINCQLHSKPSLSVFTQLATSVVFDLGLNKPVPKDTQLSLCVTILKRPKLLPPTARTIEERRALLGCFLITSIVATFLQKIDALRWTPHMDECLQILDEQQECLTDELLVQQVRLQLIVEKVARGPWNDVNSKAPLTFYLQALHSQLQEIKDKLPRRSQGDAVVLAHLYTTELTINEIALSRIPIVNDHSSLKHVKVLFACVESVKSWFEVFFTIPLIEYIGFSFSILSQLVHCLVTLYKLSTLNDPAWDKNGVQESANLLLILDQVINNLEQATATFDCSDSPLGELFSRTAKKFRSLRLDWEAKLGPEDSTVVAIPTAQTTHEAPLAGDFPNEFLEDDWMMDFLLAPSF